MYDGYNGGPLMNPLARVQAAREDADTTDTDGFCLTCHGRGGSLERQDPVGDGVGFETLFYPCPSCLGAFKCPLCGREVDKNYCCANDDCSWYPEKVYELDDEPYYLDL